HRLNLRLIPNCSAGISLPTKPAALRVNSSKGLRIRCCVVTIAALVLGVVLSTSRDAEAQSTFTSSDRIVLFGPFESGPSAPYPSSLTVSGLTGTVSKVTATLEDLWIPHPADLAFLLVGPGG